MVHGYGVFSFRKNGVFQKSIHRLVMEHFSPNPDPKKYTEINHINEDKLDNSLSNLEWCTHSENMKKFWGNSENKNRLKMSHKNLWKDPDYRSMMADAHKGHKQTQVTKERISTSQKKRLAAKKELSK